PDTGHPHRGNHHRPRGAGRSPRQRSGGAERPGWRDHRADAREVPRRGPGGSLRKSQTRARRVPRPERRPPPARAPRGARARAAAGVPVLVEPLDNIPSYDARGIRYENAALLAKAGVSVALLETNTHNSRDLRQQAGNAVSYGMTWDQALRAVTLAPAQIFGVADRYGSLEAGKVANVVVWSGDPFEFTTGVEHVLIRGKEIPLKSRQTELFERYKKLPPAY